MVSPSDVVVTHGGTFTIEVTASEVEIGGGNVVLTFTGEIPDEINFPPAASPGTDSCKPIRLDRNQSRTCTYQIVVPVNAQPGVFQGRVHGSYRSGEWVDDFPFNLTILTGVP